MWLATLHIPRQEQQEAVEPQLALQALGLRQPPQWGLTVTEVTAREVEQEAATGEEESKEVPQLEEQEMEEPGIPAQGGRVWRAQAAHRTSLSPRGPGWASLPSGAATGPGWAGLEVWRPQGRVCGVGWAGWAG